VGSPLAAASLGGIGEDVTQGYVGAWQADAATVDTAGGQIHDGSPDGTSTAVIAVRLARSTSPGLRSLHRSTWPFLSAPSYPSDQPDDSNSEGGRRLTISPPPKSGVSGAQTSGGNCLLDRCLRSSRRGGKAGIQTGRTPCLPHRLPEWVPGGWWCGPDAAA
jgi:hypothetical protein